jgi:hypothetical protein
MATMPMFKIGTSTREVGQKLFQSAEMSRSMYGCHSPGPLAYSFTPGLGKQPVSTRRSAPSFGFGRSERFVYAHIARAKLQPGPGAYGSRSAMGTQVAGNRPTEPQPGFGTSERAVQSRLFVSLEHSRQSHAGRDSPGPQAYVVSSGSVDKQRESVHETAASWGFAKIDRWGPRARSKDGVPGPGAY